MKKKHDWVNIFFMILVILIIISGICWFLGVNIPNYNSIKTSIEKNQIPTTYNTGISCSGYVLQVWKSFDTPQFMRTKDTESSFLSIKCSEVCSSKSVRIGTPNSILVKSDISNPYECDTSNNLICKCKVY
ncbi:MAG: hypothetical protein Q8N63_03535 [Nanoarchaeota archaeon]|nr:hypothetical protein [Nanoarchaeota archaeon]